MRKRSIVERNELPGAIVARDACEVCSLREIIRGSPIANNNGVARTRRARAVGYIGRLEQMLVDRPQISVTLSDVAYILDLERTYCCRVFRDITGKSFSEWIRGIRIQKAQGLLRVTVYSITDISHAVGYPDVTTFARNFRRELGLNPMAFRRAISGTPNQEIGP